MTTFTTLEVGQELNVTAPYTNYSIGGGYRRTFEPGSTVTVTRVTKEGGWIRGAAARGDEVTLPFLGDPAEFFGPTDPNAPRPRKLGEKPEGDEYLDPNDPRLQWLWDDLAKYADRKSWCDTYDKLANDIGIPGRPKDFTISEVINGFSVSKKINARSKAEAQRIFDDEKAALLA